MKIIEALLPHRPPFLMVDSIVGYIGGDAPVLNAERTIRRADPVFSGTEPPCYWPSVYIIEGLAQCCNLLSLLWQYEQNPAAKKLGVENVNTVLMGGERTHSDEALEQFLEILAESSRKGASRIGMLTSIDIEVVGRVRVDQLLQYRVEQTRMFGALARFAVQASIETEVIAHGIMVGARPEGTS